MKLPEELQFIENARLPQKTTQACLDGRLVVLTGATSGVGYQAARQLAQGGANLVLVCRDAAKAARVQSELQRDHSVKVDVLCADFARLAEVRGAAETILEAQLPIDEKVGYSDFVIHNEGTLEETRKQVEKVWEELKKETESRIQKTVDSLAAGR